MTFEYLLKYVDDCINGNIVCCSKHKWACERFIKDYESTRIDDSKFVFDWSKVEKVIKWASFFKHTKGVLSGEPISLHISQVFLVANIYGFYYRETGYRRFKKFYFQVARKNAKSQLLAVILTYEFMVFLDGGMSEVYCAATKKEQADIVYNEISIILERCPLLAGKWKEAYKKITHLKTKSVIRSLSKEDGKKGDGYNPQCACIDEYHAHETTEIYDIIESGMIARPEHLLAIITTAGFDLNSPCYRIEYKLISKILDPSDETDLENYFADVHELEVNTSSDTIILDDGRKVEPGDLIDNPYLESNWIKANPIAASYKEGLDNIRAYAEESKIAPEKERNFLTKYVNVWVNQRESGYMNLAKWSACAVDEMPDLIDHPCFVGLDLSAKLDLTSYGIVIPYDVHDVKSYCVFGKSFIPEAKFHEHLKSDKGAFYDLWEKQGWLKVTSGEVVNYTEVVNCAIQHVIDIGAEIEEFCLDPWGSLQLSNYLMDDGYTTVDVIQGTKTLSEPTKNFKEEVYQKNISHENNPVISWAISNAIVDIKDQNGNIILNKAKSTERIDPIAAILNAYVRAMVSDSYMINRSRVRAL